ncbi:MAG: FecR domain-containing protein [Gallionella sp.]|nr:FecR domain-containing protein [Gallionella sp.]
MKIFAAIFAALALFPTLSHAEQATGTATSGMAASVNEAGSRVYVVKGNVFAAQGKNPAHQVIGNEIIASGTRIKTGENSSALLRFEDGQVVTMHANSTFQVREYRYDPRQIEKSNIVFLLFKGGMRFATGLIGQKRKQAFRLLTPNATIRIHGTEFMVTMVGNSMYSQVLTGKIGMTNAAGTAVIGAGQSAVVASSGALALLVSASAIPAGAFSELLSIPVTPSAIPVPAPAPVAVPQVGALTGIVAGGSDTTQAVPEIAQEPAPVDSLLETTEPAKATEEMETNSKAGMGLTGKIGTLGTGAELNFGISDSISARVGLNSYTYKYNDNASTVNYDFKLQLQTVSALADWYPFSGSFRTSAGVLYNNNKVTLDAIPSATGYNINGTTYTTTQIGSMQGTLSFSKAAPYLGVGWGNPVASKKGWGLVSDFGVLFQGKPKVDLTAICLTTCTSLQTNLEAENTKLQDDLSGFKWWPVVSIGISYQW